MKTKIINYKDITIEIRHINVSKWCAKTLNHPSGTLMVNAFSEEDTINEIKQMIDSLE